MVELERQWSDRKKRIGFPLFPGYVFARFRLVDVGDVLRLPGLVEVVRVNGYPTPIREEELDSVRRLVAGVNQTGVMPSPSDYLEEGEEVVVCDGPFKGMYGILLEIKGRTTVVVRLSAIRQAMRVTMDRRLVRPVRI